MEDKYATELIGTFAEKQTEIHYPCPRCGEDSMDDTPTRNALSRCIDVYICDTCGTDEALRAFAGEQKQPSEWAIAQVPQNYGIHTYYYSRRER